jgi:hypothetical protein
VEGLGGGEQGTGSKRRQPYLRGRPRQLGAVLADLVPDFSQVEADGSGADRPCHQGTRECHRLVAFSKQRGESRGHVDVSGDDDAGSVEVAQDAGRAEGQVRVELVDDGGYGALPSSSSDNASTSAVGIGQLNTPAGCPCTRGVSGPHIPRR